MHQRYLIDQLANIISRHERSEVSDIMNDIVARLVEGDENLLKHPETTYEGQCEITMIMDSPDGEHYGGYGNPKAMDYGQNRNMLINKLTMLCEDYHEQQWRPRKKAAGHEPESYNKFCSEYADHIRTHGLTPRQTELVSKWMVKASLALRYCSFYRKSVPRLLIRDAKEVMGPQPKQGRRAGGLRSRKEECADALDRIVKMGLYKPNKDGLRYAAKIIKEVFEPDIEEQGIAYNIEERHWEIIKLLRENKF